MTRGLSADANGRLRIGACTELTKLAADATCIALGPGLGQSPGLRLLVDWLYTTVTKPMVIDADALNLLSQLDPWPKAAGPRILTPHPGEFRRLIHDPNVAAADLPARAKEFVKKQKDQQIVLILKGHRSLITDGRASFTNTTGNPGMATGGSGDVLTGLITALVCQGLAPLDAARLGAHLHGLAGDLASAEELGQVSLIASDLLRFLPAAFRAL
jgi:NAD(P)H-hydrate epimerase